MTALPKPIDITHLFKEQYARHIAGGATEFMAALRIWPNNNSHCAKISFEWKNDPVIKQLVQQFKDESKAKTPIITKDRLTKDLYDASATMADDNKIKAARLIAEMQGFIEKAAPPTVNIDTHLQQNTVMVMRDTGSEEEWEAKLKAQQSKLIEHARD